MARTRVGRSASTRIARAASSRAGGFVGGHLGGLAAGGTAAYFGYRGIKGFAGQVIPAGIDTAMDVAFDDPQADRAILGTDLTPSIYLGARGPTGVRGIARGLNATRFGYGVANPAKSAIGAGAGMGAMGALAGGALGYSRGGLKGAITGGVIGALGGGVAGGALGAGSSATLAYQTARANSQILNESPFYNKSALTAQRLNASGNIVLGMHNQRRG